MYIVCSRFRDEYFRFALAKTCLFSLIRDFGLCIDELPQVLDFLFDEHSESCSIELTNFIVTYYSAK